MTNRVELYCEIGQHSWLRDIQRGKPPKNCPEHKSILPDKSPTEELYCKIGQHTWIWTRRRGRKPSSCPDHLPTLSRPISETRPKKCWCQSGQHEFEIPMRRGKSPLNCPEHAVTGRKQRDEELAQEKKEKAQKLLQDDLARKSVRIEEATRLDREAMHNLEREGGANKCSIDTFNRWLKTNRRLLNEVLSLRATERKLEIL